MLFLPKFPCKRESHICRDQRAYNLIDLQVIEPVRSLLLHLVRGLTMQRCPRKHRVANIQPLAQHYINHGAPSPLAKISCGSLSVLSCRRLHTPEYHSLVRHTTQRRPNASRDKILRQSFVIQESTFIC